MMQTMRRLSVIVTLLAVVAGGVPANALPAPSKTAGQQSVSAREADLARLQAIAAEEQLAATLAAHGFTAEEVQSRLAQLSPEELAQLSGQVDQLQAAGLQPPNYIWIILAIFLGVLIITAL